MDTTTLPRPAPTTPEAAPARRFRPDIQGLRAVAVLLVVLYHADVPLLTGGYVGVDVFFVISGFLITGQLVRELEARGRISLLGFYARRARRLLPPAALVVICTVVLARFVMPYAELTSLLKDAFFTAVYGVNYHLALEGVQYQAASAPPSPLQHFWSLAVEEQFYVVWPLLMIGCAALGGRRFRRPLFVAAIVGICAVTLWWSVATSATAGSMAYFGLHTRAWELGAGALLALAPPRLLTAVPDVACRALGWVGLAAITTAALTFDDRTVFPGYAALLPVLGTVAVIAAGTRAVERSAESRLLARGPMQYVGRTSYAWYLWHWPMLILLPVWWGEPLNLAERLEVVALAFWFALLTYFLENASHRSLWRAFRWVMTGGLLSALMVVVTAAVMVLMPNLQGTGAARDDMALTRADLGVVQTALARSFPIEELPSNLDPTLAEVADDYPWEKDESCFAQLTDTSSRQCVYGDPDGDRTAVLIGDSHSQQWLNALSANAEESGWRLVQLGKSACPVARLEVWNQDLDRSYSECVVYQDAVAGYVADIRPDLIIASQADAVGGGQYTPREWASATYDTLVDLAGSRSRIAYIGDSPYMPTEANACLERHLDDITRCVYPRDVNQTWTAMYEALRAEMTAEGVGYVDTYDFFCNAYVCPAVVDTMPTHRDQGHVSGTYARWLTPMFAPVFEES